MVIKGEQRHIVGIHVLFNFRSNWSCTLNQESSHWNPQLVCKSWVGIHVEHSHYEWCLRHHK